MIAFDVSSSLVAAADIAEPHHKGVEFVPLLSSRASGASISLRSRSSQKSNTPPPTGSEKERLFRQFLQWQKRP
jgi:hypothetical protein